VRGVRVFGAGASENFRNLPIGANRLSGGFWPARELRGRQWRESDAAASGARAANEAAGRWLDPLRVGFH
jgi:hypothetical protein